MNLVENTTHEEMSIDVMGDMEGLLGETLKAFKGQSEELIPMLQKVQETLGFLPERALLEIARLTGLSPAKVFGIATFYSQFRLHPVGKHMVRVCRGTACHVKGGSRILREVETQLGIMPGESTPDLEFALETVACIGACALAPTMVIDNNTHGQMTSKKVKETLEQRE